MSEEQWIDVSYSMTVAKLKGCKLMKNVATGETKLVNDKVVLDEAVVKEHLTKSEEKRIGLQKKRRIHAASEGDK